LRDLEEAASEGLWENLKILLNPDYILAKKKKKKKATQLPVVR
jgi:hypothetical protein